MIDLAGRKALVTGAAQGLGEGMARALAAAGARVVVADLQDDLGAKVAESLGDGHGFVHLDVTDDAGWARLTAGLERVDGLVAAAGITRRARLASCTPPTWRTCTTSTSAASCGPCRRWCRRCRPAGRSS